MSCCKEVSLTVGAPCSFSLNQTAVLSGSSPDCPNRPGHFMATFNITIPPNSWVWINEVGLDFDDTYIFLVDSMGNIVFEDDDSPMGLSSTFYGFIETGGVYTIQATTFNSGQTGTIRVQAGCTANLAWCSSSGENMNFNALGMALPVTWELSGTLPTGISGSVGFDTSFFTLFGQTYQRGNFPISFTATDNNGKVTHGSAVIMLLGLSFPPENVTSIAPDPTPLPYTCQKGVVYGPLTLVPTGGVGPYTITHVSDFLPGGLSYNPATFTISGTPDGTHTPTSPGFKITDSLGNNCIFALQFCTTLNSAIIGDAVWQSPPSITENHPPFDKVTVDAMAGGDFEFHLTSTYHGSGPCLDADAELHVQVFICYGTGNPKKATPFPITLTVDVTGVMGTSPSCPADGLVHWERIWDMPFYQYTNTGTVNTPYSDHQVWTLNEPQIHGSCCTSIELIMKVQDATMHVVGTIRPLTPP